MSGWIKLYRQIMENQLWFSEPFTKAQAWVDLLLLANRDYSFFFKRGVKIEINRGQVGRSEVELSDRWKWSRTKLRNFLNTLEKEQQIIQQKSNVTLILTIINYDNYQGEEQQNGHQKDSRKTPKRQQKNTYNNDNNVDKGKNEKENRLIASTKKFNEMLLEFTSLYSKDMIKAFTDFWTEPTQNGLKLKYEMEKTWETGRRLKRWAENEIKWSKPANNGSPKKTYTPVEPPAI